MTGEIDFERGDGGVDGGLGGWQGGCVGQEEEGKTWMSAGIPGKGKTGKRRLSVVQLPTPVVPAPRTDEEYVDIDLTAFR